MKVLIADDSPMMRKVLCGTLRKWDYEVDVAQDGKEAWELCQQTHYPMVLTDWMMPEMDGLELIRRIRYTRFPGYVYIILFTARSEKQDLIAAMDAGADDFLPKPLDHGELRARMREGERIISLEQKLATQNRQLREAQAARVQSEKMASLGQLAAGMAHEINNPIAYVHNNLTVLKRNVDEILHLLGKYQSARDELERVCPELFKDIDTLEQDGELDWAKDEFHHLFESSSNGLSRVCEIVSNLRDFARLDESDTGEIQINDALNSVCDILQRDIHEKNLIIEQQFENVPPIQCRPREINQVLHSVVLNAIQASHPEGRIWLGTREVPYNAVVEVRDEGCGMDEANLPRIFEPFYTTKPVGCGSGLGLAICYGIIRDHGGKIEVESNIGCGSTFKVTLPVRPNLQEHDESE